MHTLEEIKDGLREASLAVTEWFNNCPDQQVDAGPQGKWVAWQHLDHLTKTIIPLTRSLGQPKEWFHRFGIPNRPVRTNEELVARVERALGEVTGDIPLDFVPTQDRAAVGSLVAEYLQAIDSLITQLDAWSEQDVDNHLIPHPMIGRMIVREMLFFTVFHQYHHLRNLKENYTQFT